MNELQLSKDLNVITAEINSYKQVAGQAIFEIGRRLKHVKENDLAYGQWSNWLGTIGMNRSTAHRFIKIYEELSSDVDTWQQLSSRALYEIATLPEEEREKEHVTSKGETKTVDKMTVRELQELKRKLREEKEAKQQAEREAEQARQSEQIALKKLEEEQAKEPKVIEVVPDHIKQKIEQLNNALTQTEKEKRDIENKLKNIESKQNDILKQEEALELKRKQLENQAHISIYDLQIKIHEFIKDASPSVFLQGAVASSSFKLKDDLLDSVIALEEFTKKLRDILNAEIIEDSEIIINSNYYEEEF